MQSLPQGSHLLPNRLESPATLFCGTSIAWAGWWWVLLALGGAIREFGANGLHVLTQTVHGVARTEQQSVIEPRLI
jgi:hypothetical protein